MSQNQDNRIGRLNYFYRYIFDHDIDISSFEKRMQLQKLMYILQSEGIEFPYQFTWYLRGPYSARLADDGYQFAKYGPANVLPYQPTTQEKAILDRVSRKAHLLQDPINAELVASYLYLQKKYEDTASEELRTRKPRFSLDRISEVMNKWNN